ncbi:MAG TPA: hypothetical protein EYP58_05740 [bacterium (Candidatus Stahlbacteria)]|nr:hypothetical protein [Candidatus Stahlbacteria bacterium]
MQSLFPGNQKTINDTVELAGFTIDGSKTEVQLHPFDKGIVFQKGRTEYPLNPAPIVVKKNRVYIGPIGMIEHLLAVLAGLGIDNILVEVGGGELPIFDGSVKEYYEALSDTGIYDLKTARNFFKFQTGELDISESYIEAEESDCAELKIEYDPGHPMVRKSRVKFSRIEDLAGARTFGFVRADDPRLKDYRFGVGITDDQIYPALRYPDEPIRHKLLDLIGDLYTIGRPFTGKIRAKNPNHQLNTTFVKQQIIEWP